MEKQTEIELLNKEKRLKELELEAQQARLKNEELLVNFSLVALCLVAVLAFVMFRSARQKQRSNAKLALQNEEIQKRNKEIKAQNEKITSSINYAKRIQEAILPNTDYVSEELPNSFIFFRPRDIVSGDFYWFSGPQDHRQPDRIVMVAADCTGHGVPGAFMSMVGSELFNKIVNLKQVLEPNQS
ncbi:MAG: hypothetical protein HC842_01605 [Cytophagales bacterium]|nr:hypothetical protein [Cytophagales bacterium]